MHEEMSDRTTVVTRGDAEAHTDIAIRFVECRVNVDISGCFDENFEALFGGRERGHGNVPSVNTFPHERDPGAVDRPLGGAAPLTRR